MDLKEIKPANLKEAKAQIAAEKSNAEIVYAKQKLKEAQDALDSIDRQITALEVSKKLYLETLALFK